MRAYWVAALLGFVACHSATTAAEDDGGGPTPIFGGGPVAVDPFDGDAAIASRANALFGSTCAGGPETACHASGAGGLTLRLGAGGDVVDVPSSERPELLRVKPFDPESSYLFMKVRGDGGIEGGRMPLDSAEDPRIVKLVGSWIEAGAPAP